MEKKLDAIALGESLIDFTPKGPSEDGMRLFEQNPGGAVANVMAAMAKLGRKTGFVGKVGADMHGDFLIETMQRAGIDTSCVIRDASVFTTLAFVDLQPDGQREFYFARKPGADTCLRKEEISEEYIASAGLLHVGSLSLTDEPARSATFQAVAYAKAAGRTVSYDPNYRAMLWKDRDAAMAGMRSMLPYADIIKISDEETELLTGAAEPERAAEILLSQGISIAAVTLGPDGALVATKEGKAIVPGFAVRAVDTTGAGDSFFGGFLWKLMELGMGQPVAVSGADSAKGEAAGMKEAAAGQTAGTAGIKTAAEEAEADGKVRGPQDMKLEEVIEAAHFGNAVASLNVEKRGAIPAMPTLAQVEARLQA